MKFNPGLLPDHDLATFADSRFLAASNVTVPEHIDRRPEMLEASDQGYTPRCAAYAMAGVIEYYNWMMTGVQAQVDPNPIYERAKEIDDKPFSDGTTLKAVVEAAIDLKLIPIDLKTVTMVDRGGIKRALHRHGVVLSGFVISSGWKQAKPDGWLTQTSEKLGGHAVVTIGYSEAESPPWYAIQNSWGDNDYGWRGFCRMSPEQFNAEFSYGLVWDYLK